MLGISLRLEVPLLAACLRGQQSESVSVMAVPPVYMDRSTAGDHEVLRTQGGNCGIWSDRKCNVLLPLVALALSEPEEAL